MEGRELDSFGVTCGSCERNNVTFVFQKTSGQFLDFVGAVLYKQTFCSMDLDYINQYTYLYSTSQKTPLLRVTGDNIVLGSNV